MDGLNPVKYEDILDIYENTIAKNMKNKKSLFKFEINKMSNIHDIYNILSTLNPNYRCKYNIFIIKEPKYRIVMSLGVKDKIINHYVTRYFLAPYLTKYLDIRNCATRKNMGTGYAYKLATKYMNKYKTKGDFYILKLDLSKYFYTIDHKVLIDLIKDKIPTEYLDFVKNIISSTDEEYVNRDIKHIKSKYKGIKEVDELPYYDKGKGLPIGNMTSQFLSIFYLNELHHDIIHNKHFKDIVIYMDDYIIFSDNLDKLKELSKYINDMLINKYKLKVNKKKTNIYSSKQGFIFLNYHFKIDNKKLIIKMCNSKKKNFRDKVKNLRYRYEHNMISLTGAMSSVLTLMNGKDKYYRKKYIKKNFMKYVRVS